MNRILRPLLLIASFVSATGCAAASNWITGTAATPSPSADEFESGTFLQSEDATDRIALSAMPSLTADSVYLAVRFSGKDSLAIAPTDSLVLSIDGERVALRRASWLQPPVSRGEVARYSAPASLISRLGASSDVRVTVMGRRRSSRASFGSANFSWFRTYAAVAAARSPASASSGGGAGGCVGSCPVHVRGYTRKDGTYVRPHTRSRPGGGRKN
jgi:hypothetical protein